MNCPCGAPILWTPGFSGIDIPLEEHADGEYAIVNGKAVKVEESLFAPQIPEGPRYRNHIRHCPRTKT